MQVSFLLLVFAILGLSCNKTGDKPAHVNTFSASVNGTAFVPQSIDASFDKWAANYPFPKSVYVSVDEFNGTRLFLYLYGYDGTKSTFTLEDPLYSRGSFCLGNCSARWSPTYVSKSGEIKIESFDKTSYKDGEVISGTFQFETDDIYGKYSITNGHFSVFVPN